MFKPGCGQFLSWDSGRQGDEVVKRKQWHHVEIKLPAFEIQHSNSHLLKLGDPALILGLGAITYSHTEAVGLG